MLDNQNVFSDISTTIISTRLVFCMGEVDSESVERHPAAN